MGFEGFSTENLVSLPPEFFAQVLPAISNAAELRVTLHVFWLVSRQRGRAKRVAWDELVADDLLARSLRAISPLRPLAELIAEGLGYAIERSTLLHVISTEAGRVVNWYLVNTPANRSWAERQPDATLDQPPLTVPEPPSVFTLYEQNIGLLTPMIVEELRDAHVRYPAAWLVEAMQAAVEANIRNWRYIRRILERWESDGRQPAPHRSEQPFDLQKYTTGKYAAFFGRDSESAGRDDLPDV